MSDITIFGTTDNLPERKDDKAFNDLAKSGEWLARIQLYGSNSAEVKQGKFPMAHYGLVRSKESIDDLGAQFDTVAVEWRPKAMQILADGIDSFHDPEKADFQRVVADSSVKDSGCMYGPEFLCWLPQQSVFATFFWNNPTMRRESPNLRSLLRKPATIKTKLIETKRFSWHGPVVVPCTTPLANLPTAEDLAKQIDRFLHPKESDVETVAATGETRAR